MTRLALNAGFVASRISRWTYASARTLSSHHAAIYFVFLDLNLALYNLAILSVLITLSTY